MIMNSGMAGGLSTPPDDEGPNPDGLRILSVGERYPGTLPRMGCQIRLVDTLELLIRIEAPAPREVEALRRISAYGFYADASLPHGVLIWRFSDRFSFETPFNPRLEESIRPDEMRTFLRGETNICRRVLLDENGIVRAMGMLGLDWALVKLLREKWGDPNLDWSNYEDRYERLVSGTSPEALWRGARKWTVKKHLTGEGADAPRRDASEPEPCGKCAANRAAVSHLKGVLKEAERRDADQRRQLAALRSQAEALAKDKADLQARIAALSTGSLQEEVAHLKTAIEERDFRILEMEEAALARDKSAKALEGHIDDLGRRIKWLENQLRMNGISVT